MADAINNVFFFKLLFIGKMVIMRICKYHEPPFTHWNNRQATTNKKEIHINHHVLFCVYNRIYDLLVKHK